MNIRNLSIYDRKILSETFALAASCLLLIWTIAFLGHLMHSMDFAWWLIPTILTAMLCLLPVTWYVAYRLSMFCLSLGVSDNE